MAKKDTYKPKEVNVTLLLTYLSKENNGKRNI